MVEAAPHPNADRLTLCQVDAGESADLQIVCGAPNVSVGTCYPLARVGTRLPGGMKIRKSKIRGELSFGMLCSAEELALGGEADGILALDGEHEPGTGLIAALGLGGTVIDLDLTPNRADCFSMVGVAREVATANGMMFEPAAAVPVDSVTDDTCKVQVSEPAHCPRFAGRVLSNIDNSALTPGWMRQRLEMSGIRSINPVVDVTNYVMLETGCPMHAYDTARIDGDIDVRFGRDGESLVLLDEQKIDPGDDVLVIADDSGPIALAGIMGGAGTAVLESATDVFLECAFWSPAIIVGKARRFGLHTDASMRFERGVDPKGQADAIERATALIQEIAGGDAGPVADFLNTDSLPANREVMLRRDRLAALLGVQVENGDVIDILTRLGFAVTATEDGWAVTAHSARFDIEIEADLIEEVARVYGYDNLPVVPASGFVPLGQATEHRVDGHANSGFACRSRLSRNCHL